jgi:hypothetical protein
MADSGDNRQLPHSSIHITAAASLLVMLALLTCNTARLGFGSFLTTYAAQSSQIAPANAAVSFSGSNPDAHYVRATILEATDLPGAIAEYYRAALARPDDYVLWLSLARAHELNGDTAAAVAAARQAVPLAPDYAEPHYQLGNILLRAGQKEEGFKELRAAAASNPTLMPGIIDLAWRVSGNNVQFVTQAIEPRAPETYRALGNYFRQRNEVEAAVAMYAAAGSVADQNRRSYLGELIAQRRFSEAAKLSSAGQRPGAAPGLMSDPGFEEERDLAEPGFGWRIGDKPEGFHLSLDTTNANEGHSSLRIEFDGAPDPAAPVVTQLVLVEPRSHYQLRFAVRSEGLISGGLPRMAVSEADTNTLLAQSDQFPSATHGWREYTIDFKLGDSASAVQISLQRQPCEKSPCPIFGHLWLDKFSLQKQ